MKPGGAKKPRLRQPLHPRGTDIQDSSGGYLGKLCEHDPENLAQRCGVCEPLFKLFLFRLRIIRDRDGSLCYQSRSLLVKKVAGRIEMNLSGPQQGESRNSGERGALCGVDRELFDEVPRAVLDLKFGVRRYLYAKRSPAAVRGLDVR